MLWRRSIVAWTAWSASKIWVRDSLLGGLTGSFRKLVMRSSNSGVRFCKLAICFSQASFRLAQSSKTVRNSTSCFVVRGPEYFPLFSFSST